MRPSSGRIPAFIALVFLAILSFSLIFTPNQHPHSLEKRDSTGQVFQRADNSTTQSPSSSSSRVSSSASPADSTSTSGSPTSSSQSSSSQPSSSQPSSSLSTSTSSSSTPSSSSSSPSSAPSPSQPSTSSTSASQTSSITSSISSSSSPTPIPSSSSSTSQSLPLSGPTSVIPITTQPTTSISTSQTSTSIGPVVTDASSKVSAASTNPFWGNKAAVAGTFAVAGLVIIVILIAVGRVVMKRRRYSSQEDDTYFERYPEPELAFRGDSPGPSVAELTVPAPMGAYPDRQVHYGTPETQYTANGAYARQDLGARRSPEPSHVAAAAQDDPFRYSNTNYRGYEPTFVHGQETSDSTSTLPTPSPYTSVHPSTSSLAPPVPTYGTQRLSYDSFYGRTPSPQGV